MNSDLDVRNLTLLTESEFVSLRGLEISEWQEIKGGSFSESLEAWQAGPTNQILGLGFLLQGQPIGMTLFKRPPLSPSWASTYAATIHGLKISQPVQDFSVILSIVTVTSHQAINRSENSDWQTRQYERQMLRLKFAERAQQTPGLLARVGNRY